VVLPPAEGTIAEEVAAVVFPDLEAIAADRGAQRAADADFVRELVKAEVERVNRSLAPYKKISDFRVRSKEFDKTSSKKVKRFLYKTWEDAIRE
jgi:long-chain acyl-CoA synthetase